MFDCWVEGLKIFARRVNVLFDFGFVFLISRSIVGECRAEFVCFTGSLKQFTSRFALFRLDTPISVAEVGYLLAGATFPS